MDLNAADRWGRIQSLFERAVSLPGDERAAWLLEACPDDPGIRREVAELVAADEAAGGAEFISAPIAEAVRSLTQADEASRVGERVGPYRLVSEIGHGGMGTVYLAERADAEYQARVAIKFVRGALAAPELARRLRLERQVLAGLQHPNIARLQDGGTTADGTPYLVMEYVEGEPIDAWCERRQLSLRQRIALFLRICAAVQHAHESLVVHRDLKPSNILVRPDGTPVLVDFGIAKLLEPGGDGPPEATATLQLMTPSYASPEQVRGQPVTVATDVYSLGVVLYRLLTGRLPFELSGATPAEIERRVTGEAPAVPSQVVGDRAMAHHLAGDIDTIVLKALRKEPERRYRTVAELVEDLDRYLEGRPVLARRDTFGYVAGKFVHRHRAGVTVAAAVVVLMGLLVTFYTVRLARERDVALAQATRADRVVEFLKGVFLEASPDQSQGKVLTAQQLLQRGVSRISTDLADQPETQADLMNVFGDVYRGLGMYPEAGAQLRRALELRRAVNAPADSTLAGILGNLSTVSRVSGDYAAADSFGRQAVELTGWLKGRETRDYATALNYLAEAKRVEGQYAPAESLYREVLAIRKRILQPNDREIADAYNNLALLLLARAKYPASEAMHREALAIWRQLGDSVRFEVPLSESNLAITLTAEGKYAEAEQLFQSALAERRRILGADEPRTLNTQWNYGWLLYEEGRYAQAEQVLEDDLRLMRGKLPPDHPYAAYAMRWLALALSAQGKSDSAQGTAYRSVSAFENRMGAEHPSTLGAIRSLGLVLAAAGRRAKAESLLVPIYEEQVKIFGPDHPAPQKTARALANLYHAWNKPEQAAHYEAVALPAGSRESTPW